MYKYRYRNYFFNIAYYNFFQYRQSLGTTTHPYHNHNTDKDGERPSKNSE